MRTKHLEEAGGITHIEELAVSDFIKALRNLHHYEVSEKVDGSNLQFGIDENGFYTTREQKGGRRQYSAEDYPMTFASSYMRATHLVLEDQLDAMRSLGLKEGDRIEVEVIYDGNTVPYNEEQNQIIFLRKVEGDVNFDNLKDGMDGAESIVTFKSPYTIDGKEILTHEVTHKFTIERVPQIDMEEFNKSAAHAEIQKKLASLEKYLQAHSGLYKFTNAEVLAIRLNERPKNISVEKWRDAKELISNTREEIRSHLKDNRLSAIKKMLLDELVRKIQSAFGPEINEGGWIEGLVFRDKKTGSQFKVVDKEMFTAANKFLWGVRQKLTRRASGPYSSDAGFYGDFMMELANSLGLPELGARRRKAWVKRFGPDLDSQIETLSKKVGKLNTEEMQTYWKNVVDKYENELEKRLEEYNKTYKNMTLKLQGREISYDGEAHKRTLQTFSTLFKNLLTIRSAADRAKSFSDFFKLLM